MEQKVIVHISGNKYGFAKLSPNALKLLVDNGSLVHFHKTLSSGGTKEANAVLAGLGISPIQPLTNSDLRKGHDATWLFIDLEGIAKYLEDL